MRFFTGLVLGAVGMLLVAALSASSGVRRSVRIAHGEALGGVIVTLRPPADYSGCSFTWRTREGREPPPPPSKEGITPPPGALRFVRLRAIANFPDCVIRWSVRQSLP